MKWALVIGVTGQDGAYLAEFLVKTGSRVFGLHRRTSVPNTERLPYLNVADEVVLLEGDVTDQGSIERALQVAEPEEAVADRDVQAYPPRRNVTRGNQKDLNEN